MFADSSIAFDISVAIARGEPIYACRGGGARMGIASSGEGSWHTLPQVGIIITWQFFAH